ncbi:C45 family peptidase [Leucobacter sp. BZR 635]
MSTFPRIRVSGGPAERGHQYGERAATQIAHSRSVYEAAFAAKGISWDEALTRSARFEAPIRERLPHIWEEIEGIAAGSGLSTADVLALNCRTEILWSAVTAPPRGECSSFAIEPTHTSDGSTLVGQNWDWLEGSVDSVVVLEVDREDGPNYVTIVEAGLLGKTMLNEAGIAMCVNTLVTSADGVADGIPFHVMLRALADSERVFDAVLTLGQLPRASSGNYVLAGADGTILNIEAEPGGPEGVHPIIAEHGRVLHTNHFRSPLVNGTERATVTMADSYVRLGRLDALIPTPLGPVSREQLSTALADHRDAPGAICCHPDPRDPAASQWSTVMSVIIDVAERTLLLSEGRPCETPRASADYSGFLGRGTSALR